MGRLLRVEYPGAIYHVNVRMLGDARSRLFVDDRDRARFLKQLQAQIETHEIRAYAFCLMLNHYHLLLETPLANLGRFMHDLKTAYSNYYNPRHQRHGHLYDGRYKAKLVEGDEYLLTLSRYIHLNPVWGGEVEELPDKDRIAFLSEYPWSSYRDYVDGRGRFDFIKTEPLLEQMHGQQRARRQAYRRFALEGVAEKDEDVIEALKASPLSVGSDSFREWVSGLYERLAEKREVIEDVSLRPVLVHLDAQVVLQTVAEALGIQTSDLKIQRRGRNTRGIAARALCRYAGLSQRETARILGLTTGSAVSHQLRRLDEAASSDRRLQRQLDSIDQRLAAMRSAGDVDNYYFNA